MTSNQPELKRSPHASGDPSGSPARNPITTRPCDDSQLVQRAVTCAKAGDPEGLHFLYARYAPDVLRYVASFVHDYHEAEDITQDVFAKLVKGINKYEQREVPFAAWILRVARYTALDYLRARRAIPTEEVRMADSGHSKMSFDRRRDLHHALEQLPDEQREVLVLRHVVGLSPMEIADTLGKSESSIHGLHHRGRRALQFALQDLGAAPVMAVSQAI
jgi:RNA polymerase sigma-70 factor, ECF subfamily